MHDLDAMPGRLEAFLAEVAGRPATVHDYSLMTGGYSRVMARAEVEWADGTRETLVLRGDPPPEKTMLVTDRDAEWAVLQFLAGADGFPMPAPRFYDASGERLGTKAIVLDFCSGPSMQAELNALVASGAGPDDARLAVHRDALVDTMTRVAAVPLDSVPAALARPASWGDYMSGINGSWRAAEIGLTQSSPIMRFIAAWLDAHRPPPMGFCLQHGDFQPANILLDPEDGSHRVIDWEYAHIGDPREDLGWYISYSAAAPPGLYAADPEAFLARFRERTGASELQVNQATAGYFSVVGTVKVFSQLMQSFDAMGAGASGGVMTTYNINAATVGHTNFLGACAGLAEPLDALRAAWDQLQSAAGSGAQPGGAA